MRLLLDQGLPRRTAELLRGSDIDAIHTGEIEMARAEDSVILARAEAEGRVVVTLDADFHRLLAKANKVQPSVIRIRIEGLRAEVLARILITLLDNWAEELRAGATLTVQPGRIRYRKLPL